MQSSRIFRSARWVSARSLVAVVACAVLLLADQGCQHIGAARAGHVVSSANNHEPLGDQAILWGRAFDDGSEMARADQKRTEDREWRYRNRRWRGYGGSGYGGYRR